MTSSLNSQPKNTSPTNIVGDLFIVSYLTALALIPSQLIFVVGDLFIVSQGTALVLIPRELTTILQSANLKP